MPYTAEISRSNPTCFLVLIDQSASMAKGLGGDPQRKKSEAVADAVNRLLQSLVFRCAKGPTILDRYYVGVIGYGKEVGPVLGGALSGSNLFPISEIGNHPLRVDVRTKKTDDGAGGIIEQKVQFPIWYEARADGKTPMKGALEIAQQTIAQFVDAQPGCFPPIILNITDGEATDCTKEQLLQAAENLQQVSSDDGHVLLFNLHISEHNVPPVLYPSSEQGLPDEYAKILFKMSSKLPAPILAQAQGIVPNINDEVRGFVFNADLVSVVQFLDIGTRTDQIKI